MANTYVNKVELADGTPLMDISDTTAVASDVLNGKYFYGANGAKLQGTGSSGVSDVQIDGTSIVSNGIADVPFADNSTYGVVKLGLPFTIGSDNRIAINGASSAIIKLGTNSSIALSPARQHESTFYGLAKAAGDSTQASSSNAVGSYTNEAKAAIRTMIGVEDGVAFVETVTGTTPVITGEANTRYMCGEVATISITPPSTGIIDVLFTSGTTPTVLTIPNTVKFPAWFNPASLNANTVYELNIMDGVYGAVIAW